MSDSYNQYYYIQQMQGQLQCLQDKVCELEKQIEELTKDMKKVKDQPTTQIQYSFDQLKIERLDGTLNIGLSSESDGKNMVEDFTVGGESIAVGGSKPPQSAMSSSREYTEIMANLEEYMNIEAPEDITKIEEEQEHKLDESYRELILNDIRTQLPGRLEHYLQKYPPHNQEGILLVENKVKGDVYKGIEHFISSLKNNNIGGEIHEIPGDQS
ncbi:MULTISPECIES: spore germination protein GerPC [Fictibacillus]|uniref:Spore germination protein GerPC n=1 Tax=Fictibacillus terranigra TaxID=3058424 RepID=A0ABT8EBA1_9BACL|nr:spore germination protein GerPC [Fictibacillus sp. CENA-BCM004]MDN4075194.1 spore germination protein GerPC [Fictibacillus sp. CENA-BCM004]